MSKLDMGAIIEEAHSMSQRYDYFSYTETIDIVMRLHQSRIDEEANAAILYELQNITQILRQSQ